MTNELIKEQMKHLYNTFRSSDRKYSKYAFMLGASFYYILIHIESIYSLLLQYKILEKLVTYRPLNTTLIKKKIVFCFNLILSILKKAGNNEHYFKCC